MMEDGDAELASTTSGIAQGQLLWKWKGPSGGRSPRLSLSIVPFSYFLGISHIIFFQVVIATEIESLVETESLFMEEDLSE